MNSNKQMMISLIIRYPFQNTVFWGLEHCSVTLLLGLNHKYLSSTSRIYVKKLKKKQQRVLLHALVITEPSCQIWVKFGKQTNAEQCLTLLLIFPELYYTMSYFLLYQDCGISKLVRCGYLNP